MNCSFCGNPEELTKYIFVPLNKMNSDKYISDACICEACLIVRHRKYLDLETHKYREMRKNEFKGAVTKKPQNPDKK